MSTEGEREYQRQQAEQAKRDSDSYWHGRMGHDDGSSAGRMGKQTHDLEHRPGGTQHIGISRPSSNSTLTNIAILCIIVTIISNVVFGYTASSSIGIGIIVTISLVVILYILDFTMLIWVGVAVVAYVIFLG